MWGERGWTREKRGGLFFTTAAGDTIEIGGDGGNAQLGKAAANTAQTKAINAAEVGSRVREIQASFKPEYQQLGTKLQNYWRAGKAKIDPNLLSSEDTRGLLDFAKFQSRAIGNVNRLLNELSGAAVSPQEAERLKAEVPNPGTGWFDGDDPVTFQAKMDRIVKDSDAALARYKYYQAVGLPSRIDEIPLADVQQIGGKWYVRKGGKVYEVNE